MSEIVGLHRDPDGRMMVGFWKSELHPDFPVPVQGQPWEGQRVFVKKLLHLEEDIKPIISKGWSTCRICGCANSNAEYHFAGYVWPGGLAHYVHAHNVRPPEAFLKEIDSTE
jgi:hypothetical protein